MKKKYGPLPLWAWVVVIGGTIGVYLLYKNGSSSSSTTANTTDAELAAEQAAEEAATGTTGTTGDTGSSGTTDSTDSADLSAALDGISTQLATMQATGLQDTATETPVGTFADEINDVTAGATALGSLASLFGGGGTTIIQEPATTTAKGATLPALTASGAVRAPSGPTKPNAPNGFTSVGIGNGNWEFVPIIKAVVKTEAATKTEAPKKEAAAKTQVSGKKKA